MTDNNDATRFHEQRMAPQTSYVHGIIPIDPVDGRERSELLVMSADSDDGPFVWLQVVDVGADEGDGRGDVIIRPDDGTALAALTEAFVTAFGPSGSANR